MNTKYIGDKGEKIVANKYRFKFYKILERNFKSRFGEIDIIAQKGETIVFIEVKTRKNSAFMQAQDAVTFSKQNKIKTTAAFYLQQNNLQDYFVRFDVVEVYTDTKTVNIIKDAFD